MAVVGASLAGLRAAQALRREGYDGTLTLVGSETHPPYDRPPLSKEVLAGEWEPDRTALPVEDGLDLDLRLGVTATALDLAHSSLSLDDGSELAFDGLVIATGAAPRHLPGTPDLAGVHVLRSLDDCIALRSELERGSPDVAVVGAGFIGSEVAASCRKRGLNVTVIEALPLPLVRVLGPAVGEICAALHRDRGVDLRLATTIERFEGGERVERLVLSDGSAVAADVVVVGIGVKPATEWLEGSGLRLADGVLCDETCRVVGSGDVPVVAAGDVARWHHPGVGDAIRVEHWTNATEQADAAAATLLGRAEPFAPVPYFWSDQYDVKIQFVGLVRPDDDFVVVDGDPAELRFVAAYGRAGKLVAALAFNNPRQLMQWRRRLVDGSDFPPAPSP